MIETLSLRNFKILREVDVELRPFTLLVGPNASGKSTLLEALLYLTESISAKRSPKVWWASARSMHSVGSLALGCRLLDSEKNLDYWLKGDSEPTGLVKLNGKELTMPLLPGVVRVRPAVMLRLDVKKLAAPSYSKSVELRLPPDGEGLSSILAGLQLEQVESFNKIVDQLRVIVPGVNNVRIKQALVGDRVGFELRFDMTGAEDIPAWAVSDGTLLTLGLLTLLGLPDAPRLVLIDELEHGLHPKALKDLVLQLRRLQEESPDLQILATSHSPYLLDHFRAEEILLTSLDEEGYAVIKPLTDHPEYERWKDLMAPGEFWSTVGESWITETEPKKASATGR